MLRIALICLLGFALGAVSMDGYAAYQQPRFQQPRPVRKHRLMIRQLESRRITDDDLRQFGQLPAQYLRQWRIPGADEVALGRMLYFDKRLSKNHDISCNSCHPLGQFGMDRQGISRGHLGQTGRRNAPTVYNAAGNGPLFWDGRARSVEQQAMMPLLNPFEMAMTEERVLQTIQSIPEYVERLRAIYPNEANPVSLQNVGEVIGAFERQLVTPGRWDDFLAGDRQALTAQEKRGFITFVDLGCPTCHAGPLVGGTHLEPLGQSRPWPNQSDLGANAQTDRAQPVFKVASLRNVAKTAPYFHDASADTLEAAVRKMAAFQLGTKLEQDQADDLVAWLKTLTGDLPRHTIWQPTLPPSTDQTPRPTRDGY